ncbi:hypothetical protein CJ030_MR5G010506 [Morella rubra]|uniref:Reverse transcriptase zinc-binding domain-containing protein n=1 Tax=Morella rubra TaxID=262757 RepID=A0A6A1VLT9_9ROSI|nr:hypothetical protein CJ030_MR5G010506 [Morella rubra]
MDLDLGENWLIFGQIYGAEGTTSTSSIAVDLDKASWGRLWKLKLHDRLKMLLWQIAAGALKNKGALARVLGREEEESFLCSFCRQAPEDSIHLLVRCSVACIAWRESPWAFPMDALNLGSTEALIGTVLNVDRVLNISKGQLHAFALNAAIIFDCLWFLRNKIVHENVQVDTSLLILSIRRRYAEHAHAWLKVDGAVQVRWMPPKLG